MVFMTLSYLYIMYFDDIHPQLLSFVPFPLTLISFLFPIHSLPTVMTLFWQPVTSISLAFMGERLFTGTWTPH